MNRRVSTAMEALQRQLAMGEGWRVPGMSLYVRQALGRLSNTLNPRQAQRLDAFRALYPSLPAPAGWRPPGAASAPAHTAPGSAVPRAGTDAWLNWLNFNSGYGSFGRNATLGSADFGPTPDTDPGHGLNVSSAPGQGQTGGYGDFGDTSGGAPGGGPGAGGPAGTGPGGGPAGGEAPHRGTYVQGRRPLTKGHGRHGEDPDRDRRRNVRAMLEEGELVLDADTTDVLRGALLRLLGRGNG